MTALTLTASVTPSRAAKGAALKCTNRTLQGNAHFDEKNPKNVHYYIPEEESFTKEITQENADFQSATAKPPVKEKRHVVDKKRRRTKSLADELQEKARREGKGLSAEKFLKSPTLTRALNHWRDLLSAYGYGGLASFAFTVKERNMARSLLRQMRGRETTLLELMEAAVGRWEHWRRVFAWGSGKSRLGRYPTFTEFYVMRAELLQQMHETGAQGAGAPAEVTYTSVDQIPEEHPQYEELVRAVSAGVPVTTRAWTAGGE